MSNCRRSYIDLSEEEIKDIKNEILKKGTDNFNSEEYNISKTCYEMLVEEIICWGINGYEYDEDDDYWEQKEQEERDSLYHDDEYYDE